MTRTLCTLAALLFSSSALAQEAAWAVEDVVAQRFADADVEGPQVTKGARVSVLVREDDRVRVRVGTDYGWIPATAISAERPAAIAPPATLDQAALEAMLEELKGGVDLGSGLGAR